MRKRGCSRLLVGFAVLLGPLPCVGQNYEDDTARVPGTVEERCDNGVDDDGDTLVDCQDPDCSTMVRMTMSGVISSATQGLGCHGAFDFPPPIDSVHAGDAWSLILIYDHTGPPIDSRGNRRFFHPAISSFSLVIDDMDASALFNQQTTSSSIGLFTDTPLFSSCISIDNADIVTFERGFAARTEPDSCSPRGISFFAHFVDQSLTLFPGNDLSGIPTTLISVNTGDFDLAMGHLRYGASGDIDALLEMCPAEEFSFQVLTCEVCEDGVDNDGDDLFDCDDPDCTDSELCNGPPACPTDIRIDLWPPNHTYANLDTHEFLMVTDPDGDDVTVSVTGIAQDEDINGTRDGNTICDAAITGETTFRVRRERQGGGNGRVYTVSYLAEDGNGGECGGTFEIGISAEEDGPPATNDGALVDSLACLPTEDVDTRVPVNLFDPATGRTSSEPGFR